MEITNIALINMTNPRKQQKNQQINECNSRLKNQLARDLTNTKSNRFIKLSSNCEGQNLLKHKMNPRY